MNFQSRFKNDWSFDLIDCRARVDVRLTVGHVLTRLVSSLSTDTRYMVADCGGGTVDITVYEMLSRTEGKLRELYKATGGPYGSIGE